MDRRDLGWAASAGAIACAVYVRTLAPGVVAEVDSPMFQFIGRVLGVAHNPGYPLYVLVTHVVSSLPIGSLPYRINLFSAVCGALAVSLTYLVARRLECGRLASLAAALGLAFGQVFWSQAVIAEVYTMHAALVAGVLLGMLEWGRSRRSSAYYTGIAALAAGLAHHTTIVAFLPAVGVYVWRTDRAFLLRLRTVVTTGAILAAGLLPYGFIVIRSNQPGAYLESKATSVAQLRDVMLARQFGARLFAFDWQTVMTERLAAIAGGVLAAELTLPGTALAIVGGVMLFRRRPSDALLVTIGGAAVAVFALNYSVVDTPVFLIPTILVLWLLAGVGVEHLASLARAPGWAAMAVPLAALLLPAWLLAHNLEANDRSTDTGAGVFLDRLFAALPARTALVHEDFLVDRLVMFKLLGEGAARGRAIDLVGREADAIDRRLNQKDAVFAFGRSARTLRLDGLDVGFEPLAMSALSMAEIARAVPDGSVVALAAPASLAAQLAASAGATLESIGGPAMLPRSGHSSIAIVGVRGARSGALVRGETLDTAVDVAAGASIGDTGREAPSEISLRAGATQASVRQGSRDIVSTSEGAVLAIWARDGRLTHALVLQAVDGFRARLPAGPLSVFPVRRVADQQVRGEWADVTESVAGGGVVVRVPARQTLILQVSDDGPLQPRVVDQSADAAHVEIRPSTFQPLDLYRYTSWIEVRAAGSEPVSAVLAFGGRPRRAMARLVSAGPPASLVAVSYRGLLRAPDRVTEVLQLSRDEQSQLVGAGWSRVDADPGGPYRWMTAPQARLLLPIAHEGARRIRIQAFRAENGPASIRPALNGAVLPSKTLQPGWHAYEWELPADFSSPGPIEAVIVVDGLGPTTGNDVPRAVAVASVSVIAR